MFCKNVVVSGVKLYSTIEFTNPIPQKPENGKSSIHNDENTCHKCFLPINPVEWDKEKDTTVKKSLKHKRQQAKLQRPIIPLSS